MRASVVTALLLSSARAQLWMQRAIAGGANAALTGTANGSGTAALFTSPTAMAWTPYNSAFRGDGNIFVVDGTCVRSVSFYYDMCRPTTGRNFFNDAQVTTVAGRCGANFGNVDGAGTIARFSGIDGIASVGAAGSGYFGVEPSNSIFVSTYATIRRITVVGTVASNTVVTVAGSTAGYLDAAGTNAQFQRAFGLVTSTRAFNDGLFIADFYNHRVRHMSFAAPYNVVTVAGQSHVVSFPYPADGTGTNAVFSNPRAITISNARLYVSERCRIRTISPSYVVSTLAGGGFDGFGCGISDGTGTGALLSDVSSLYLYTGADSDTSLVFRDSITVRVINADGAITTLNPDLTFNRDLIDMTTRDSTLQMKFQREFGTGLSMGAALSYGNCYLVSDTAAATIRVYRVLNSVSASETPTPSASPTVSASPTRSTTPTPTALSTVYSASPSGTPSAPLAAAVSPSASASAPGASAATAAAIDPIAAATLALLILLVFAVVGAALCALCARRGTAAQPLSAVAKMTQAAPPHWQGVPAPAASVWIEARSDEGATFFLNNATGETAWALPEGASVAATSVVSPLHAGRDGRV